MPNKLINDFLIQLKKDIEKICLKCEDREVFCSTHCVLGSIYNTCEANIDERETNE